MAVHSPFEVVTHNTKEDCWVSFLGKVLDRNIKTKDASCLDCHGWERLKPLRTGDIQHYIHPETGVRVRCLPPGPIPDVSACVRLRTGGLLTDHPGGMMKSKNNSESLNGYV
ncbi:hypothetical protein NQ317_017550 [Molorchus minor]|uniref:Uncharacterized protein n=1 Tax=Molorchus minor TaxID=1323400 RepID=A0ABQ9JA69_9CUCU|nr:hypothetical protein NQ317_017550 [Molorchus minor]